MNKMWEITRVAGCLVCVAGFSLTAAACTSDENAVGRLTVTLDVEDVVTAGIAAGEETEDIRDGWSVNFDALLATVGPVRLALATDATQTATARETYVVDLTRLEVSDAELWSFDSLSAAAWEFNYATPDTDNAQRHSSAREADFEELVQADGTYLIDLTLSKEDGVSCPPPNLATTTAESTGTGRGGFACYANSSPRMRIAVPAATEYGPCEVDGIPGVRVVEGGTSQAAITLHVDHLFFNGFPEGDEGGVTRLAQWLADCDLDVNGEITRAELEAIAPSDLAELDERYALAVPFEDLRPVESMWTYIRAQLKTQGHFEGEGECPADNVAHDHHDEDHEGEDHEGEDHEGEDHEDHGGEE